MNVGNWRVDLEPRLTSPKWLYAAVPIGSLFCAFIVGGVFLVGHHPHDLAVFDLDQRPAADAAVGASRLQQLDARHGL